MYFGNEIRKSHPNTKDSRIEALFKKEKFFMLPGEHKDDDMTIRDLTSLFVREVDVRKTGEITLAELQFGWNRFAGKIFTVRNENEMGCSIM